MMREEKIAETFFNDWAKKGKAEGMAMGHSPVAKTIIKNLLPFEGKTILDLSCGNGWALRYFLEMGAEKGIASDISVEMLKKARKNLEETGKPFQMVKNSVNFLPFKNRSFDIVFNMESFYYYKNPNTVLSEIHRVLRKKGIFLLLVDFFKENRISMHWAERIDFFMNPMSKDEYASLLRNNGFRILDFGQAVSPKIKSKEEFIPSDTIKTYEEYLEFKNAGTLYFIAQKHYYTLFSQFMS